MSLPRKEEMALAGYSCPSSAWWSADDAVRCSTDDVCHIGALARVVCPPVGARSVAPLLGCRPCLVGGAGGKQHN